MGNVKILSENTGNESIVEHYRSDSRLITVELMDRYSEMRVD